MNHLETGSEVSGTGSPREDLTGNVAAPAGFVNRPMEYRSRTVLVPEETL
ncbi:hypothetical protein ACSDR0_05705 [Streptosporangium sp. G11]